MRSADAIRIVNEGLSSVPGTGGTIAASFLDRNVWTRAVETYRRWLVRWYRHRRFCSACCAHLALAERMN